MGRRAAPCRGWGWPRVAEASAGLSPLHLERGYYHSGSAVTAGAYMWNPTHGEARAPVG